ncbi:uncharacterized protein LOC111100018 [Crassostrea virginica]
MLYAYLFILGSLVQSLNTEYLACPSLVRGFPELCEDLRYSRHCAQSCKDHRLTCHNCHDTHQPSSCNRTTTCGTSETCVITAALDHSYRLTYRQGCFPKQNCSLFVHDNVSGRRNTVLPGDCCYTSFCNHYKPEAVTETPLTCYSCAETSHPRQCNVTTQCHAHQLCVVTQSLNAEFKLVYRLGCMDRHQCEAFRHDGLGTKRSFTANGDCCEHDRCNSLTPDEIAKPSFNAKECKDIDANVCQALRHSSHSDRCDDMEFANVFCPKTCRKCFFCHNCFVVQSKNQQTMELCNNKTSICQSSYQSCLVDKFENNLMMACVNDSYCAGADNISKSCCKHDYCNDQDLLTTTTSTTKPTASTTTRTTSTTSQTRTTHGFITIPHEKPTTTAFHWASLGTPPPPSTQWVTIPWSGVGQAPQK